MLCNTRAHTLPLQKALPGSFGLLPTQHCRAGEDYKEVIPKHALLSPIELPCERQRGWLGKAALAARL
jgi:hypothetical protein